MPGRGLCVSRDKLLGTFGKLRENFPEQIDRLDDFLTSLKTRGEGELVDLEDLRSSFGMDLQTVLTRARWLDAETRDLLQCLLAAGGKTVRVRKSPRSRSLYLVTGIDALPDDFAPAVILDASARVRYGYTLWGRRRGGVRLLKEAPKSYEGLTVHYWAKGASPTKLKENAEPILTAIASAITDELARVPEAKWLVISRKPKGDDVDLEERVQKKLPVELRSRVFFRTWGQHTATNAFSDCTHIMLVGGIYLEDHNYEAQCLAIGGYDAAQSISPEMKADFAQGEKLHDLLQAACRIGIRNGSEVKGDFHVYLIAAACHGLAEKLGEVFPHCRVIEWRPQASLSGYQQKALLAFLTSRLLPGDLDTVRNGEIRAHLGLNHHSQLYSLRNDPGVIAALEAAGIEQAMKNGKCVGYRCKAVVAIDSKPPARVSPQMLVASGSNGSGSAMNFKNQP
jgi:hypothetical protein